jgi:hypothetical protein
MNYRNIALAIACGALIEVEKEVQSHSAIGRAANKANEALAKVLQLLPDRMSTEEVVAAGKLFFVMEALIIHAKSDEFADMVKETAKILCKCKDCGYKGNKEHCKTCNDTHYHGGWGPKWDDSK